MQIVLWQHIYYVCLFANFDFSQYTQWWAGCTHGKRALLCFFANISDICCLRFDDLNSSQNKRHYYFWFLDIYNKHVIRVRLASLHRKSKKQCNNNNNNQKNKQKQTTFHVFTNSVSQSGKINSSYWLLTFVLLSVLRICDTSRQTIDFDHSWTEAVNLQETKEHCCAFLLIHVSVNVTFDLNSSYNERHIFYKILV